jgi:hypothetical protein
MASYSRKVEIAGKNAQELYDKISSDIDRFLSKSPIGHVDVERDAAKRIVTFKSSMASGSLACLDGAVDINVKLSLLASPFKGKIDEGIQKWIAKTFSTQA